MIARIAPDRDPDRVARIFGYCLVLGDYLHWQLLSQELTIHLREEDRVALAWAALRAVETEHARSTAATVLRASGGLLPAFLGGMEDARHWAALATSAELKAHALAAFDAMRPSDQTAFLDHLVEQRKAA